MRHLCDKNRRLQIGPSASIGTSASSRLLTTVIDEHRDAFGGGWEDAGSFASRFSSTFQPRSDCRRLCPIELCWTWRSCEVGIAYPLAVRRLIDSRSFRPLSRIAPKGLFKCCRKRRESIKVGHLFRSGLSRARSLGYLQQSTRHTGSLDPKQQARHRRRATAGMCFANPTLTRVFNPRSRVSVFRFWRKAKGPCANRSGAERCWRTAKQNSQHPPSPRRRRLCVFE